MTRPKPRIMATLCARQVQQTVGYAYDMRMEEHYAIGDEEHPERPARHGAIVRAMKERGLEDRCVRIGGRLATEEEYLAVHTPTYVATIEKTAT